MCAVILQCGQRENPEVTGFAVRLGGTDNFGGRGGKIPVRGTGLEVRRSFRPRRKGAFDALGLCGEKEPREGVVLKVITEESH